MLVNVKKEGKTQCQMFFLGFINIFLLIPFTQPYSSCDNIFGYSPEFLFSLTGEKYSDIYGHELDGNGEFGFKILEVCKYLLPFLYFC